jgi:hypothetical protein
VELTDDLRRIADTAVRYADDGEELTGILAAEPAEAIRVYLCSYGLGEERRWLALDADGRPVERRSILRDAVSIAALCELAEESAGGGDLDDLTDQLVTVRDAEAPEGVEEAEEAARALQDVIGTGPHVATHARLDELGQATRRLEVALGEGGGSPFAEAMKAAMLSIDALTDDVERKYKRGLQ